jgi:hypothetical protein
VQHLPEAVVTLVDQGRIEFPRVARLARLRVAHPYDLSISVRNGAVILTARGDLIPAEQYALPDLLSCIEVGSRTVVLDAAGVTALRADTFDALLSALYLGGQRRLTVLLPAQPVQGRIAQALQRWEGNPADQSQHNSADVIVCRISGVEERLATLEMTTAPRA